MAEINYDEKTQFFIIAVRSQIYMVEIKNSVKLCVIIIAINSKSIIIAVMIT
jgi:hypothetical protein